MNRFKSLSALTATWVLVACSSSDKVHSIASIELRPRNVSVMVGERETLTVVARDDEGKTVEDAHFTWKTSDGDVVEVDDGTVTGLAEGTAKITASADGETSDPATVTVEKEATEPVPVPGSFDITLSSTKLPVLQGTSEELTVTLTRSGGFTKDVTLSEFGLPQGTTANGFTFKGDVLETKITVKATDEAPFTLPTSVRFDATAGDDTVSKNLTLTVYGHPGELDTTFGGGSVTVPVGGRDDYAFAAAVQKDGKILVAGRSYENQGDFALIRLERDGTPDTTFGLGGKVTTPIGAATETAYAVALQEDGKIVLAGSSASETTGLDFAVVRYATDGSVDKSFGDDGKVVLSFTNNADTAYAVVIQQDRKIVVAGDAGFDSSTTGLDFALARLDPDGKLDETFGDGGKTTASISSAGGRDSVYGLALHQIGGEARIVAVGGEGDFQMARFRASGELDGSFGEGGKINGINGSVVGAARAVQVASDGKLVVAGHSAHDFALARFEQSGALDETFGEGGKTITAVSEDSWDEGQAVAIESTGKIVVGGWAYAGAGSNGDFALARYGTDGVLDQSFGTKGIVLNDTFKKDKADEGYAMVLQSDDRVPLTRVILAGSANDQDRDFAVSRFFR